MDTVAPTPTPLGPSEIARDWGTSRQYAAKCIKAGCPVGSLEAARVWRTERTVIRQSRPGGCAAAGAAGPAGVESLGDDIAGSSLEDELGRVKQLVEAHAREWQASMRIKPIDLGAIASARRAYREAVQARIDLETMIGEYRREVGMAVDLAVAQRMVDERLSPLRSAMHGLDREIAKELFPDNPAGRRPQIRSVISRIVLPAVAMAKRRLREKTPPHDGRPLAA